MSPDHDVPPKDTDPTGLARKLTQPELPKRFYKQVSTRPSDDGVEITLDGRPVRTPAKRPLAVPDEEIAATVAREWDAQETEINPSLMPMTRLLNAAIDGVADAREAVAADIAAFAGTDMLCYRADMPEGLVARQREVWDPILAWAEGALGARFMLVEGVMPVTQPDTTLAAVRARMPLADPFALTALHSMTTLTGSVLVALAVWEGHLTVDEAWLAAHVDEDWNIKLWGADAEAMARRDRRETDMRAAAQLASRFRPGTGLR
ncbi:ATP12 family chaperone protein [Amorphus coralli]|uniref:ATP12 family chaperone protein n=1 Tax=Amorphus coralli TaxID=340680 RepID=UPI0003605B90|nr:ATP12 family protein [Amorphus coralli]